MEKNNQNISIILTKIKKQLKYSFIAVFSYFLVIFLFFLVLAILLCYTKFNEANVPLTVSLIIIFALFICSFIISFFANEKSVVFCILPTLIATILFFWGNFIIARIFLEIILSIQYVLFHFAILIISSFLGSIAAHFFKNKTN